MAFLQVQFFSKALDVASTVNVILPEPNQGIGVGSSKGRTVNNPTGYTPRKPALVQRDICTMAREGF